MKKNIFIVFIVFILGVSSSLACDLANVDWKNIHLYSCNNLIFKETSTKDFLYNTKGFKHSSNIDGTSILINTQESESYKLLRAGFEQGKLDWIDFEFKNPIPLEETLYYFDNPVSISKDFNNEYDYYNYDYFNLSVNKEHTLVYSLNLFGFSDIKFDKEKINSVLPDLKTLDMFTKLAPGDTSEKDFQSVFPFLKPHKESRFSENSNYVIGEDFLADNKDLSKVVYVFKQGLLSFISIYPEDTSIEVLIEHYGYPLKVKTISKSFTNCQYSNFSVIIDENNKIKNIGVFSSI